MKTIMLACAALAMAGAANAQAPANQDMSKAPDMDHAATAPGANGVGVIKKLDLKAGSRSST
jgi:hypothetical protein